MLAGPLRGSFLLALLASAGCLEAHTTACGELVCPRGRICSEVHETCVLPEQLEVCEDLADETTCTYTGVSGECYSGVCLFVGCGNGVIEGTEVCDDSNAFSGDGCSSDCRSDETCGNGTPDFAIGERCDDGNTIDGDGCQADCSLARCGDGIVDPDEACDDGNDERGDGCNPQCTSDETCGNGVIDVVNGEECDDDSETCGATCRIVRCGNGILDPGELCDDGNNRGADGCSPGCNSDETCGNGEIDVAVEEQCDDGNLRSGDGCSSRCAAEIPQWTLRVPSEEVGQKGALAVFDGSLGRVVRFGGEGPLNEPVRATSTLADDRWIPLDAGENPGARIGHAMVYDAARRRTLVFGGREPQGARAMMTPPEGPLLSDVWALTNGRWTRLADGGPFDRHFPAAAYHVDRAQVVAFGGRDDTGPNATTWILDDGGWRTLAISGPSARSEHVMAWDGARRRVLLFGGLDASGTRLNDTWVFDGDAWTELTTATRPTTGGGLAHDASRGVTVLFGGPRGEPAGGLWELDGSDWRAVDVAGGPEARWGFSMVYDPIAELVRIDDGTDRYSGPPFDHSFDWNGTSWTERENEQLPPRRNGAGRYFDPVSRSVGMIGGDEMMVALSDTWRFDGSQWIPGDDLPALDDSVQAVAYDRARRRVVLVALETDSPTLATWERTGHAWIRRDVVGPSARVAHELVYDTARGVVTLYGGRPASGMGPAFGDVWDWDGTTWTERVTMGAPPSRREPMVAFDEHRGVLVVFGGLRGGMAVSDLWELDGTTWTERTATGPGARSGRRMTYFPASESLYLWGGGSGASTDTWEWHLDADSGELEWTEHVTAQAPGPRAGGIVAADAYRDVLVVAGGDPNDDTWELELRSSTATERCDTTMDEDGDGLVSCMDPDCFDKPCGSGMQRCEAGTCACAATEPVCDDGADHDCDGLIDCDDPDCASATLCQAETSCTNGLDDDGDGLADCADPGCAGVGTCVAYEARCDDMLDDDGDGLVDCADPECWWRPCEVLR
ncbi:MAG: kelch repeat-containing protein [Polyangiales bacterium]